MPDNSPSQPREGRVVTFYSYKGGTGRTMALANVAWILAAGGNRVLVADWDLESPGLHRFFHPFLGESTIRDNSGIIDLIREYLRAAGRVTPRERAEQLIPNLARIQLHAVPLGWEFPAGGGIDYVSPGRQNTDYAATLGALDWDDFYESLSGGEFLDALRADMKERYDYVLIDSRTGLSDIASICTVHFPDILVDCFTFSTQGIEGAAEVARLIRHRQDRSIRILPVPMRVDDGELQKVDAGRKLAMRMFEGIPADMDDKERRDYWAAVEVPYKRFYAFEETLAVFGDAPGNPGSLLSSFERIAARITDGKVVGLPRMDEQLRDRTLQSFTRQAPQDIELVVECGAEDQIWAEWIAGILHGTGVSVREQYLDQEAAQPEGEGPSRTLTIISSTYRERHRTQPLAPARRDLALYVTAGPPLAEFSGARAAVIGGASEAEATERVLTLLDLAGRPETDPRQLPYYPGREPRIERSPARNTRFTGRDADLRDLRLQLNEYGTAVVLPVALHGLGGVGKTQIALEYVHRFKADYDLVYWLDCSQPQFIDASLNDLAIRMQAEFEVPTLPADNPSEQVARVVSLLEQGKTVPRWLLVYDNAEDIEAVQRLLPQGGGHVLITSRNRAWSEKARPLPVEVFTRAESIAHLRDRVLSISEAEADRVADVLGDLPLAVALAGAWLAETGYAVDAYLTDLQQKGTQALNVSSLADYPEPLSRAWDLSLSRLRERSKAAMRLFELCSVMEARIALDILYSQAMAEVLEPFDPALTEPMVIGRTVQEMNRLALIKLDAANKRVHVHRLVQAVVKERMADDQVAAVRRDVHQVLAAIRPRRDVDDPETWHRFRLIWPHLEPSRAVTSDQENVRLLFIDRVRYLWLRHDLAGGRAMAMETALAWEEMLAQSRGKDAEALRRQLLLLRFNLANILRSMGQFEDAKTMDEQVFGEQSELLGPDHPHTLMTAGGLAADLRALGKGEDALKMDRDTYPAWTELYGEDNARTLSAAHNLADSLRMTADFSAALRIDEDTLERRRTSLGMLHPRTLDSSKSVARDLVELGRYPEAVALMQSVLKACADAEAGPVAEWTAGVLLGIALRGSGRPEEAAAYFREALEGLTRRFGESSTEALSCRLSYAGNLLTMRQPAAAEQEIRKVLDGYRSQLGPSHPHGFVARLNLADALHQLDRRAEALTEARSAAAGLLETLGEMHPYALAAQVSVAVLLAEGGDLPGAEVLELQAVARLTKKLGADHPDTLRAQANLLLTRMDRGDHDAELEREEVISQLGGVLGGGHPHPERLRMERRLMRTLDPQPF